MAEKTQSAGIANSLTGDTLCDSYEESIDTMKRQIELLAIIILMFGCKSTNLYTISERNVIGDYISCDKNFSYRLLITNEDFKYWKHRGHGADFTQGKWKIENDKLVLQSKELDKAESLTMSLSTAHWIFFENKVFKIKKNALIETESERLKFTTK